MARLLIVHHTSSPSMQAMLEAVLAGAGHDDIEGVEVVIRPALTASEVDVLTADAYLLGTPANIGYMSGALKHFFDGIYYPCLEATRRRPYGLYVHGGMDTGGAVPAAEITGGRDGTGDLSRRSSLMYQGVASVPGVTWAHSEAGLRGGYGLGGAS